MHFSTAIFMAAALAGLSSAYTQPVGANPVGNPTIYPAVGDIVPKGKASKITWHATTKGTVTILLLRGPSTNAVPLYPIVEKIPNTGSYEWTPKSDLTDDTSHYGLQIIDDANGQYQYTPQFGIGSGDKETSSAASAATYTIATYTASSSTASAATYTASSSTASAATYTATAKPPLVSQVTDGQPQAPSATSAKYTYITSKATTTICSSSGTAPAATYSAGSAPASSSPSAGAPSSSSPAPASTSPIAKTGAAGKNLIATGAVLLSAFAVAFAL